MNKFILTFIGILITQSLLANGDDKVRCSNPNSDTFQEISTCLTEDYNFYDKKLNEVYTQRISTLSAIKKVNLRSSQRQWIKKRNRTCTPLANESLYGKEGHFEATMCMTETTKERIKFLESYK
ncbi:uncharacterized protein YecT (DUF1311 family) [Acinetobacter calcoaceticus]|uniref:Uncharacterized protein YecT (DUF1311 family) n=1 Tax=Acinetobacter calcoaceticus TaxID=471 RepID=A0A4R1XB41_ACICA|nr:uncharacterized protein YecT (DUF1311 family) [Acinetobacter calcoaceticus]